MTKYRLLLADDHAIVRAGIRNALENLPEISVEGEAKDGPTLMKALEEIAPDILLIDVTMPDFEPISVIRQIKASYPKMKILVISAYDDDVYVQGLLGAGVDGYHLKDQPLQDLSLAIKRILMGERWISSSLLGKLVSPSYVHDNSLHLTTRQKEILNLLKKGWNNQKIAYKLDLSVKTIENHLTRIYRLLDVQSRLEAVNFINANPSILTEITDLSDFNMDENFLPVTHSPDILLVDDNPRFRYHLRRIINKLFSEFTIYEAETVEEAIQIVKKIDFRLIFIDVILGEQSGISCLQQLNPFAQNARIILISAYPDKEFRRQGINSGAAAFIDKKMLDSITLKQIITDVFQN
jgi:DNA-binding NarL/FixJ family response regulator